MTHFFTLTPGVDNFTGLAGDFNQFEFTPSTLQSTDTITGVAAGSFLDILVATAGGTIASTQFQGVTLVEQLNLASAGNNVTLSNSLVAGSSVGYFAVVDGGGSDTVDASTVTTTPVVFFAGAGSDTFKGGGGNDAVFIAPANLSSADTFQGGPGADNLYLTAAGTVAASAFTNVTGFEGVSLSSFGNTVTLSNSLVTGASYFSINDGGGNDVVDASAVTTTPVVFFAGAGGDFFTGGHGNDAVFVAVADLTSADDIHGGTGVDNLYLTTAGTVAGAAFTNVGNFEGLVLSALGNNVTLTNTLVASSDNGVFAVADGAGNDTIDASGVTNGSSVVIFASSGGDTYKGGNGLNGYAFAMTNLTSADTVVGGSAVDNLVFTTAGTLAASAFTNVTGIETIVLANGANHVTLTNGLVAGTSIGYFAVVGSAGSDTVDASGITNGKSIVFNGIAGGNDGFSGGNGADSFQFAAGQLTAADTVLGGGGADTLWMTTAGTTNIADQAGVSGIEGVYLQNGGTFHLANGITAAAGLAATGSAAVDNFDGSAVTTYAVSFSGNGGADTLAGGSQNDTFFIADSAFAAIDGNGGIDRITLTAASQSFNLTANAAKISDLEVIDLTSSLNSTLTLAGTDIALINAGGTSLYVVGDVDDTVNAGNGYTQIASGVINNAVAVGRTFNEYQHSSGSLLFIDSAITAATATTGTGSANVPEGTAAGATVFNAQQAGATTYVLGGADAALFSIDATGHISFNASPDFETPLDQGTNNIYDLTVTSSNGTATPNFVETVTLTVTDLNDSSPVFNSGGTASTPENVAITTPVYTAHANDADVSSIVSYALAIGGDNDLFDINSTTGAVTFKVSPDFENPQDAGNDNIYDISVTASDGVPAHDTTQAVQITVTGVNETPAITSDGGGDTASVNVAENSTAVTTVTASDPDLPVQTLTYTVLTGAGSPDGLKFTIDGSGHLSFVSAPDFEAPGSAASSNSYTVQVQVTDNGVPTANDIQTITVNVQDANDVAPSFTSSATPTAVENDTTVVTLTTTDPDTVGTNPATFSINAGLDGALFTITGGNQLVFNAPRDYETQAHSYSVDVTASDGVNTTVQHITVALGDANDNAPIFSSGAIASTAENVATNVPVYTALAPDADGTAANNTVSYSLAVGGDNDLFDIDAVSGAVTFKNSPDFETPLDANGDNIYEIAVTASDGLAAHDTTQSVSITVTDENDIAPAFASPTGSANVNEATSTATVVFDADATDGDGTPANSTITYSLGGADVARFNINSATGEVTFAAVPNFEGPADAGADNQYDITVTASDGVPAHDATQSVTITVGDLAPVFDSPADGNPANNEVSNGAAAGAATGVDANATDPASGTVTYELLDASGAVADGGGRFTINSSSGVVTVSGVTPIVFDGGPSPVNDYTISVRASDASGAFTTQDFVISVTPNNAPVANDDAASATEAGGLNNAIAGTDPSGNVITATGPGDVADTDPDAGDSVTVVAAGTGTEAAPVGPGTVNVAFSGLHGSLLINTDGSYSYTVNQNDAAVQGLRLSTDTLTDSFNYTIQDGGGLQDKATLTFTIHGANDSPIANADAVVAVEAGGVANATPGTNPSGNVITGAGTAGAVADTDPDSPANGELLTVVGVAAGSPAGPLSGNVGGAGVASLNGYGTLTIGTDGTYGYVVNNSNAAVQALRTSAQTLTDTFSYTISDAAGVKSTTTVTVTIDGANDAPVAHADVLSATEAGGVSNATAGVNPAGNLITGAGSAGAVADTDVDSSANGELLSVVGVATGTQAGPLSGNVGGAGLVSANGYGTLTVGTDGTYSYVVNQTNTAVQQLHLFTDTLTDTFSYTLSDAAGATSTTTVTITIHGANDLPLAVADTGTMSENDAATLFAVVVPNDVTDPDTGAANTIAITGTVTATSAGDPLITNGDATAVVSGNQIQVTLGADFQTLTGTETATVTVPYTLTGNAGDTSSSTLTVTVNGVNDGVVANDDAGGSITEDAGLTTFNVRLNDTLDVDHTAPNNVTINSVTATDAGGDGITGTDVTASVTAGNDIQFTLGSDFQKLGGGESSTISINYTLHGDQGIDTDTATLTYTVTGVNDAPTAANFTFNTANGGAAIGNTTLVINDPTDGAPDPTGPQKTFSGDLLAGASDIDTASSLWSVSAVGGDPNAATTSVTTASGTIVFERDGDFTFTPAAGFTGNAVFNYQVNDNDPSGNAAGTGTITIEVAAPKVWYVDANAATNGDGTSDNPFNSLTALNGVTGDGTTNDDVDGTGDIIFLYDGTYAGGIVLEDGQQLIGQRHGLTVNGTTLETATGSGGAASIVNGGVVLASSPVTANTIQGVDFGTTAAAGFALSGTNVGNVKVNTVTHGVINNTTGGAVSINGSGTGMDLQFDSVTSTGANGNAILLQETRGSFSATAGTLNNGVSAAADVRLVGNSTNDDMAFTFGGSINDDQGQLVQITGQSGGTKLFSGAITDGDDGDGTGIDLNTNGGATINFTGGLTLSTGTSTAFNATGGGTVNVTDPGAANDANFNKITTTSGTALNVANTTIGGSGLTFQSISANGAVNGIVLNNTGTSGGLNVTGSGNTANSGGTIQNTTGDAISIQNSGGHSFNLMHLNNLSGGGFFIRELTGTNTISKSTIENFNVSNENAIDLLNSTANNATLTLDANLIQHQGPTNGMAAVSIAQHGGVNFTFNVIDSNTGDAFLSKFTDLFGSAIVMGPGENGSGYTATLNTTVSNTQFVDAYFAGGPLNAPGGINDLEMTVQGNSVLNFDILNNHFANIARGNADALVGVINVNTTNSGRVGSPGNAATISGNTITNLGTGNVGSGGSYQGIRLAFDNSSAVNNRVEVLNNDITDVWKQGILLSGRDQAVVNAVISGNTVGSATDIPAASTGSGFAILAGAVGQSNRRGVEIETQTNSTVNVEITNNSIYGAGTSSANSALALQQTGATDNLNATVTGNTITNANAITGGHFRATTLGTAGEIFLDLRNNSLENNTKTYDLTQSGSNTFRVEGPGAAVVTGANIQAQNTSGTGVVSGNVVFSNGVNAPQPSFALMAAAGGVQASSPTPGETHLTQSQLDSVVAAAIAQWAHAGASAAQLAAMAAVTFSVADLSGKTVGDESSGHITIDIDAAGHGWFVDPTPSDNSEFTHAQNAAGTDLYTDPSNAAAGHLDLLTTVTHELGHVLGLADSEAASDAHDLMHIDLADGERRLPDAADVAQAAEADIPQIMQAPVGTPIVAGNAAGNTIDAGHGGNVLFGGAGADTFVFGSATPLDAPTPAQVTHVADYSAAQGDTFDFSAITSAFHNSNVSDSLVVRAVEDASGKFAMLQVDHIDPMGMPSAPNWVNVAQLDGAHAGDSVNVLIDNHSVHLAQIHVDLLA